MPNYQKRYNWFWVSRGLFPEWPYKDNRALITRIDNATFRNRPVYRFEVLGEMYEINAKRAWELADLYQITDKKKKKWHLIPKEELATIPDYDPTKSVPPKAEPIQALF